MKNVLPNGMTIEGTVAQVNQVRRSLGYDPIFSADGIHYNSSSKGVIRIDTMDDNHIKNAVRKHFTASLAAVDTRVPNAEFLKAVQVVLTDVTLLGLLQQLQLRNARGF